MSNPGVDCPIIVGDPTLGMVQDAYSRYSQFALQAWNLALQQAALLQGFTLKPIDFTVDYQPPGGWYSYVRPNWNPPQVNLAYAPKPINGNPPNMDIGSILYDAPPVDTTDSDKPSIQIPGTTPVLNATAPGNAPQLAPISLPSPPNSTLPAVSTLYALNLPATPQFSPFPQFTSQRPIFTATPPAQNFHFTPTQYSSPLLSQIETTLTNMLTSTYNNGTGIPDFAAAAMRARGFAELDAQELADIQQAYEEFSSRGFTTPTGVLYKRIAETRQTGQNRRGALNRDVLIRDVEIAVENLRFSITSGVQLEGTLMAQYTEFMRLSLQAAQFALQASIEIFNANVSVFNAQMQAYAIDAQVFRDQLLAIQTEVEIYKSQIDAQRLVGEINQQLVSIYETRVRALLAGAQIYTAQIEGVRATVEANGQLIAAFRAQVEAYSAQVNAYTAQWEGYKAQVDAQVSREKIYETAVAAYGQRVSAWSTKQNTYVEERKMLVQQRTLQLDGWKAALEANIAALDAENKRIDSNVRVFEGYVKKYSADASVEESASMAHDRFSTHQIQMEDQRTQVALRNAEIAINQLVQTSNLLLEARRSAATVLSQLTGSALSTVNFHAGVQSSVSQAQSCGIETQYQVFPTA